MTAAAFKATYAEWRVIKTRAAVQIVFELPIEKADEAYQALGGMPIAAREVWCAIARLNEVPALASPSVSSSGEREPASDPGLLPERGHTQPPSPTVSRIGAGEAERRKFSELPYPQQAALRCNDPIFRAFLREMCSVVGASSPDMAAAFVRKHCCVKSRSDIQHDTAAEIKWQEIESWFAAWKTKERAMA
jgi:hypothetical protein